MKAVVAATMLLLVLVAAATVASADHRDDDGHHHQRHRGQSWHRHSGGGRDGRRSTPLAGLTQCVTSCGSGVTSCMLDCYQPLVDLDPVELPVCLLKCTNDAMVCATGCPVTGNV
uniref:Uncharacterized protein n=1 Tax=Zea mays TaxID=4577 RepID=B6TXZ9_MAIZE|nr:hypothetical protein [Zea mays]